MDSKNKYEERGWVLASLAEEVSLNVRVAAKK